MTVRRIRAKWATYRRVVLSPKAPQVQLDECKLAFYAGASALLSMMNNELSLMPDDVACSVMANIQNELSDFAEAYNQERKVPQ